MIRRLGPLACLALLGLCTGCATVIHGTKQKIHVTSEPPGATVTVLPEKVTFVTPFEVELARKKSHTLLFELACHAPAAGYVDRRFSYATYGNLVLGGFLGISADIGNGAAWKLLPDPLHATLERTPPPADGAPQECAPAGGLAGAEP